MEIRESDDAYDCIVRVSQRSSFPTEHDNLQKSSPLNTKNRLLSCDMFLDSIRIIHARGRNVNASFSYDTKFPVVLSIKSRLAELFVEYAHVKFYHANGSFLLNYFRLRFYMVDNFFSLVKKILYGCVFCIRLKAKCEVQIMGDLPKESFGFVTLFSCRC